MEEKFESIADLGFPDLSVSRQGHIWSKAKNRVLKGHVSDCGYIRVCLKKLDGTTATYSVHRLIAEHFIPNPENKPQVNHKDGNKLNNAVDNLEWATNLENAHHAMTHGLMPHAKLDDAKVHEICQLICRGLSSMEISEMLNVPFASVNAIRCRRNWTHISDHYPFTSKFVRSRELSEDVVHQICKDLVELKNIQRRAAIISKRYDVDRDIILKIACGKNWKHISCQYPDLFRD